MAEIDVLIESDGWQEIADIESRVISAAYSALSGVAQRQEQASEQSLCILLADDSTLQQLNLQFRGQDKPTNVLSFPSAITVDGALGDIAIAYETCLREAQEEGKTIDDHLIHLVIHGTLHLLGYDHETDDDAEKMERHERDILAQLGIADPYSGERTQHGEATR